MRSLITTLFLGCTLLLNIGYAQQLTVEDIQIGEAVEERQIVGAADEFEAGTEQLFCLTHITGADEDTEIFHVWVYEDEEVARVELPVRSNDWRTWSSKSILESWTGNWRVEVEGPNGEVLVEQSFRIGETQ